MTTITVGQRKGGNGKTTSSLNLSHAFARKGKKVLLIDLDDQRNTSGAIGATERAGKTVVDLLTSPDCTVAEVALESEWEGVSVIPSSAHLSGVLRELDGEVGGHLALKEKLDACTGYDLCLIDTSPSLNTLFVNALCASRYLFVPLSSKYFSLHGLEQTLESFRKVRSRLNGELDLVALAFVIHDGRSALAREVVEKSRAAYGGLVCDTVINQNILIEEAQVKKQSIFTYASGNRGAAQYAALADELLARMER